MQILDYTVKYLDEKLTGDKEAMNAAENAANDLRASSKFKKFPGLFDQLNVDIKFYVDTGNQLAKNSGLTEETDEYAIVTSSFVLQSFGIMDDIYYSYAIDSIFIALGSYINNYTVTRGICHTNTKQVYVDYKIASKNSSDSIGKALVPMANSTAWVDLYTLDINRLNNTIKYRGDKFIIVDREERILDGSHRLKYALENNKAVNETI